MVRIKLAARVRKLTKLLGSYDGAMEMVDLAEDQEETQQGVLDFLDNVIADLRLREEMIDGEDES